MMGDERAYECARAHQVVIGVTPSPFLAPALLPHTTAVTQRSLIPTLDSRPPDATWCGVCVSFVAFVGHLACAFAHSGLEAWALTFSSRHLRTPSTVAGRAQHYDQDPQVRDGACPPRALVPIDLCVGTRVCAVICTHSCPPSPLSRLVRAPFLYAVCSLTRLPPRSFLGLMCTLCAPSPSLCSLLLCALRGSLHHVNIGRFFHVLRSPAHTFGDG
jgi:hypothetical protein